MTVMTPEAVAKSFKQARLGDAMQIDADEMFYFRYPSPDLTNQVNGDGDLLEIWDYSPDFSVVVTERGNIPTTPETTIYYR